MFPQGLANQWAWKQKLNEKKMGNTLQNKFFFLRGYCMCVRVLYIRMHCDTLFWAMIFVVYGECFGP